MGTAVTACGKIVMVTLRLRWNEPWQGPPAPHLLRGWICERVDDPTFHQHGPDGECLYRYPLVQYRWDGDDGVVVAFQEAAFKLAGYTWQGETMDLGDRLRRVRESEFRVTEHAVVCSDHLITYRLRQPWLALNQRNWANYQARSPRENVDWLGRHAGSGILTALRGMGIDFGGQLYAAFRERSRSICRFKDLRLTGLLGEITTNADLPDGFAIGKATAHGYGWLDRLPPTQGRRAR